MNAVECISVADWLEHLIDARREDLPISVMDSRNAYGFMVGDVWITLRSAFVQEMYTWFDTVDQQAEILEALGISLGGLSNILHSAATRREWFDGM